jgi:diketogulonate reductase-like aldo/keto reductase
MQKLHFMYGTAWKEEATKPLTLAALRAGFRAIDTANQRKHYFEAGVGDALLEAYDAGVVQRGDLFLQTKFTYARGQDHRLPYDRKAPYAEQVAASFASSLEHLHTDYLDSYVLHGPEANGWTAPDRAVWSAMEALVRDGRARVIGVSNVDLDELETMYAAAAIKPAFVQNRCYARTGWDRDVRRFCTKHGIIYQGFSLLTANREIFKAPAFTAIVKRTGRTPAQVVFRFAQQVGMLPLTGTSDQTHMREDLAAIEVELTDEDVKIIERISGSIAGT